MKKETLQVRSTKINISDLKKVLKESLEVSAAYLFGSAAAGERSVNDLDIMILLHRNVDKNEAYINLKYRLSKIMNLPEECIDLIFFDLEEADLTVLTKAVNKGILLKNDYPEYLSNIIDTVSRYLMENEPMMIRGKRLRQERLEAFCET